MKIFTKSLLTLMLLCVAGVVNAQERVWHRIAIQGWCHEYRDVAVNTQTNGPARQDEDGVYYVFVRSAQQATDAGATGDFVAWDSQFFIDLGEENYLKEGDKIKVTLKAKSDAAEEVTCGTQSHGNPGNFSDGNCVGTVHFGAGEWIDFESGEVEITANMAKNDDGFRSIAFNLASIVADENTYYFKDIVVEVYTDKKTTKTAVSTKYAWTKNLVNNSDCESDDVSSYRIRQYPYEEGEVAHDAELAAGEGVDGSQCVKITTNDMVNHEWDTQFWILLNEEIPAGTKLAVEFDYKAENDLVLEDGTTKTISTQAHSKLPGGIGPDGSDSYIFYSAFGSVGFTSEWQHFKNYNFNVTSDMSKDEKLMGSLAFNLNDYNPANVYFLDNVHVGFCELINDVRHNPECVQVLFTDYTNMPDLLIATVGNKSRAELPEALIAGIKVKANGEELPIGSVEYDKAGQLYIFIDDEIPEEGVEVTFTNPADANYRLVYTNGDKKGQDVEDFVLASTYDENIDAVPFKYGIPDIEAADPEDKSFSIDADLAQFSVTFDKGVQGGKIEAKLDGKEKLNIELVGEDGIILKRTGTGNLEQGDHTITISTVYAATDVQLTQAASFTIKFSVGPKAMPEELQNAINNAQKEIDASADEENRYAGDALTATEEAVAKYTAEGPTYTAPSKLKAAVDDLNLKAGALAAHRKYCTDYDENLMSAEQIVAENAAYSATELYQTLAAAVAQYSGKVLTNDDELKAAVAVLKDNVAAGKLMFTNDWTESKSADTGIKVLVERIRTGVEALLVLGYDENDEAIVNGKAALDDNDDIAQMLKNHVTKAVYDQLKDEATAAAMFESTEVDQGTGEWIPQKYDMTVFIKNPNIYKNGSTIADIPGWTVPTEAKPGIYGQGGPSWGNPRNVPGLPEDVAFTTWHPGANMRMEQTITDLPAGVYVVEVLATDWANANEGNSFAYAKASDAVVPEEGAEPEMDVNYTETMLFTEAGNYQVNKAHDLAPIEVKDGKLTIGAQFGAGESQYMFEGVRLYLVGAAEGFDYVAAAQSIAQGIKNANTSKVRSISMFDLNGRSVKKASKGIVIVKKVMGDGTVQTSKVVK